MFGRELFQQLELQKAIIESNNMWSVNLDENKVLFLVDLVFQTEMNLGI